MDEAAAPTQPEVRWLTEEERRAWVALARTLFALPGALDAQLQRDADISHFEYQVMSALSEAPERTLRMSDLAGVANGSLSRLSHAVRRLEKGGWVRRGPHPQDGRCTLAVLTDDGWRKVVEAAPGHVEAVRTFVLEPLTAAQVRQLAEIGTRIRRAVGPDDLDGGLRR